MAVIGFGEGPCLWMEEKGCWINYSKEAVWSPYFSHSVVFWVLADGSERIGLQHRGLVSRIIPSLLIPASQMIHVLLLHLSSLCKNLLEIWTSALKAISWPVARDIPEPGNRQNCWQDCGMITILLPDGAGVSYHAKRLKLPLIDQIRAQCVFGALQSITTMKLIWDTENTSNKPYHK